MCPTPDRRGLAGGFPEHCEGETSLGELGEVSEERGSRPNSCNKFLPSGGPSGAYFWGRNMGLDGNDAVKTGGGKRGFLEAGDGDVARKLGVDTWKKEGTERVIQVTGKTPLQE